MRIESYKNGAEEKLKIQSYNFLNKGKHQAFLFTLVMTQKIRIHNRKWIDKLAFINVLKQLPFSKWHCYYKNIKTNYRLWENTCNTDFDKRLVSECTMNSQNSIIRNKIMKNSERWKPTIQQNDIWNSQSTFWELSLISC